MATEQYGNEFVINIKKLLEGMTIICGLIILVMYRNTVMKAMQAFDPEGVALRSKRRLQRREYFSKV